jgi:hypothetical protein
MLNMNTDGITIFIVGTGIILVTLLINKSARRDKKTSFNEVEKYFVILIFLAALIYVAYSFF